MQGKLELNQAYQMRYLSPMTGVEPKSCITNAKLFKDAQMPASNQTKKKNNGRKNQSKHLSGTQGGTFDVSKPPFFTKTANSIPSLKFFGKKLLSRKAENTSGNTSKTLKNLRDLVSFSP